MYIHHLFQQNHVKTDSFFWNIVPDHQFLFLEILFLFIFFKSIYFVSFIFLKTNIQKINLQMLQTLKYSKTYIKYVNKHNI